MQGPIQLSQHPLVYALGWTLLHFCWQGAAVALMLGCVLGLLGGRSSQARYAAACLALGLMVALPVATFAHVASAEYKARTAMLGSSVVLDAGIVLQVGVDQPVTPWPARIAMALDRSLPWVLLAWFAGVLVFIGRLNFGLLVARRLKTAGTEPPPPDLLRLFDQLRIRLRVDRAVQLLHSTRVHVPTVIGWLRPVVLLPVSCLTGLSPDQIEAVLCHELAHVRRHDYLVSVIQSVIETILFYHPAVWWVSKQVRRERECCCDELAVEAGGDVLAYARALSFLEENRAAFPEFVLGANGGVLKMRIQRILGAKRDAEGSPAAALVVLGLILALAGSYFAADSHAQARAQAQPQFHAQPQSPPWELAGAALPTGIVSLSQEGIADPEVPAMPPPQGSRVQIAQAGPAAPQSTTSQPKGAQAAGGISGTVYDPTGALVSGAKVTATNTDDGVRTTRVTDNSGTYSFTLPPGPYIVEIEAKGFQRLLQENIQVKAGQTVGLNIKLSVGATEHLTVTAKPPAVAPPPPPSPPPADAAVKPAGPQRISAGVMQGLIVSQPQPVYPDQAKAQHVQGVVVLGARIAKDGTVEDVQAYAGPPLLIVSAVDAVRQWKYKPFMLNGEPTEVQTTININYTLAEDGSKSAPPSPPEGSVRSIPADVMQGNLISKVVPVYPESAKAAHVQGVVVLHALISKTGDVEDLKVISGPPMLTGSAIDAVRQWKYDPYMFGGETMEVETTISVNFSLADAATPAQGAANEHHGAPYEYDGVPVRRVGGSVTQPELIYKVDPVFSAEAKKAKFNGIVLVNLIVDAKGHPQNVHVLRGAGMGLDEKAMAAVKKYKFKPATELGQPVPVGLNVEVNFQVF
jgi:TonB family protein